MSDGVTTPLELLHEGEIRIYCHGNPKNTPLVCVHGLMGDTIDFVSFYETWGKEFFLIIPEIAPKAKDSGYMNGQTEGHPSLVYEGSVDKIKNFLDLRYPGEKLLFTGISLGGKLCIEFAGRYPDSFKGAVVTDVGVGPLCGSDLYYFLKNVIPSINLAQEWKELKNELKEKIPDRMLRLLVQSSISYEEGNKKQAKIKDSMNGFTTALEGASFEDQHWVLEKLKGQIVVLKATQTSAIMDPDAELMMKDPRFFVVKIQDANHFIQINNKLQYEKLGLLAFERMRDGTLKEGFDEWNKA
jgi:pimeloyl-ACP methyl ester carboxylesterase